MHKIMTFVVFLCWGMYATLTFPCVLGGMGGFAVVLLLALVLAVLGTLLVLGLLLLVAGFWRPSLVLAGPLSVMVAAP